MYFPILRGRQYELLALRDCVNYSLISNKVIPVIEPVKVSKTLLSTLQSYVDKNKQFIFINNPCVGSWYKEQAKEDNEKLVNDIKCLLKSSFCVPLFYLDENIKENLNLLDNVDGNLNGAILFNNQDYIDLFLSAAKEGYPMYAFVPDKREYRRTIKQNKVIYGDYFIKRQRNADYASVDSDPFSSDHLYFQEENYVGFSDYSIVGSEFSETGFAPYAIVIHIAYFDSNNDLRIKHFVSDSNDLANNPAGKYYEAVSKLVEWNSKEGNLKTFGIKALEKSLEDETYPGLGMIKKYTIMHHLELMSSFLGD